MRGWLLDTNVVAELISARCASRVSAWVNSQPEDRLFLSILTFGEYQKGLHLLTESDARRSRITDQIKSLHDRFFGRIVPVSEQTVLRWGAISGRIKRLTGHPPPVIDTLFAAAAIETGLYLATRNIKDVAQSGAALFNPWEDDPIDFPVVT